MPLEGRPHIAIRLWGDNLARMRLFTFDFYDTDKQTPIGTPEGLKVVGTTGFLQGRETDMHSLERWFGIDEVTHEVFAANEGETIRIVNVGKEKSYGTELLKFKIPSGNIPPAYCPFPLRR